MRSSDTQLKKRRVTSDRSVNRLVRVPPPHPLFNPRSASGQGHVRCEQPARPVSAAPLACGDPAGWLLATAGRSCVADALRQDASQFLYYHRSRSILR